MDEDLRGALELISGAGEEELGRIGRAVEERRRELALSAGEGVDSQVVEARPYEDGWLQLEWRPYERKDGGVVRRGPYWYFRYHEGGKQRKLYVGKTDDPEGTLARKRGRSAGPSRPVAGCGSSGGARPLAVKSLASRHLLSSQGFDGL